MARPGQPVQSLFQAIWRGKPHELMQGPRRSAASDDLQENKRSEEIQGRFLMVLDKA